LANLTFALTVDPENDDLIDYFNNASHLRSQNIATIPTDIATEKKINPFLRSLSPALVQSAKNYTNKKVAAGLNTFTVIRAWKNNF
jgi:hydroxyacylglutathione hydrolase